MMVGVRVLSGPGETMSKTPSLLVPAILVLLLAGCGGGGHSTAIKATDGNQDPNFSTSPEAVPGHYLAGYAKGAYLEPVQGADGTWVEGNGEAVAAAICAKYGATLDGAYIYVGSFSFSSTEAQARAMSHDARVDVVEEDAVVHAAATPKK